MAIVWDNSIFETMDSTQNFMKDLAEEGALEGRAVQALSQTKGRGRQGREWSSQEGNLHLSFLIRPDCLADEIGALSLLCGLALARTLEKFLLEPSKLSLKWPNDVLLEGIKCAGLLLETSLDTTTGRIEWLVVGLGVNVAQAPQNFGCALNDYAHAPVDLALLRERLFIEFESCYTLWQEEGFVPIKAGWLEKAHDMGAPLSVKITPHDIRSGAFDGLDDQGALRLLGLGGRSEIITAGDVYDASGD